MRAEQVADPEPGGRPVPINAKFDNDFVTVLVLVLDTDTLEEAAAKSPIMSLAGASGPGTQALSCAWTGNRSPAV
ncbi:MAG TPA: toluene-4-monooxygenase system B family protein [Streptosporangiaceae bacterium]